MDLFKKRRFVIMAIFVVVLLLYVSRLFYLQVIDDTYKDLASRNVVKRVTDYPTRGLIYDRNGKTLVVNGPVYDIYVIPAQLKEDLDKVKLSALLGIDTTYLNERLQIAKDYSWYKPSLLVRQLSERDYAVFQEYLYQYKGIYGELRTIRYYPYNCAAHVVGYIGEVNEKYIEDNPFYQRGDFVGVSGLEKTYEEFLRGKRGTRYVTVDALNREQGSFAGGDFDTLAEAGKNITISLDVELQLYGEELMQNKRGSIVAIEPSTGEILAFVSSPTFNPNLLSGRERGVNFTALNNDNFLAPLFNRPVMASYPPGSTLKPYFGAMALQEGVIKSDDAFPCYPGWNHGSLHVGCRYHPVAKNLPEALQHSCNAYFCYTFQRTVDQEQFENIDEGLNTWKAYMNDVGFGEKLGIDIADELPGLIPGPELYNNEDRYYGKGRWKSPTIISLSIGQGEIGITPLQLANMSAAIANRGYYYTPHFAKQIAGDTSSALQPYKQPHDMMIDSAHMEVAVEGMYKVIAEGTGRRSRIPGIEFCGKTGTAQNPHGEDHSLFVGFAPKDDPKIAIAVVVENAGGGSTMAAPIGSFMVEKYLNDTIQKIRKPFEKTIKEADFLIPEEPDETEEVANAQE